MANCQKHNEVLDSEGTCNKCWAEACIELDDSNFDEAYVGAITLLKEEGFFELKKLKEEIDKEEKGSSRHTELTQKYDAFYKVYSEYCETSRDIQDQLKILQAEKGKET